MSEFKEYCKRCDLSSKPSTVTCAQCKAAWDARDADIAKLTEQNRVMREALEKIEAGTEDITPPFRVATVDVLLKIAQAALDAAGREG